MLLIAGVLVTLIAVVVLPRVRLARGFASPPDSVSDRWLANYRASHL